MGQTRVTSTFRNFPAWDDGGDILRLPALTSAVHADVCVIGLGGSGLSCIHELIDNGASVVGIDAGTVGGGAAGRNGGFLLAGTASFYHDSVKELGRVRARAIHKLTLTEIDRIERETPAVGAEERLAPDCGISRGAG